jgi:hypothetical protein
MNYIAGEDIEIGDLLVVDQESGLLMKERKTYRFGNLNFGGAMTEEFMGGKRTTEAEKNAILDFMEGISKLWNGALNDK